MSFLRRSVLSPSCGWKGAAVLAVGLAGADAGAQVHVRDLVPLNERLNVAGIGMCAVPDARGFVWLCTPDAVLRFDGQRAQSFPLAHRASGDGPTAVYVARSGAVWAGTQQGELARLDVRTGRFERFARWQAPGQRPPSANDSRPGRPDVDALRHSILSIAEDRAGNPVVAGRALGGITRFDPQRRAFSTAPLDTVARHPRAPVRLYADWQGTVWGLVVSGGLVRIRPRRPLDVLRQPLGLPLPPRDDDGAPSPAVHALAVSAKTGAVWVGVHGGLARYEPRSGRFRTYPNPSAPSAPATLLAERPDGQWWTGGPDAGLFRFDPSSGRFTKSAVQPEPSHLSPGKTALVDRAGRLWLTSVRHATLVVALSGQPVALPEGLRVPAREVVQDVHGRYYLMPASSRTPALAFTLHDVDASPQGRLRLPPPLRLARLERAETAEQAETAERLRRAEGVPIVAVSRTGGAGASQAVEAPAERPDGASAATFRVVFSEVRVPTRPDSLSRWILDEARPAAALRLGPSENAFVARVSVLGASALGYPAYEHRLEGHGEAWEPVPSTLEMAYANVPPGRYRVQVRPRRSSTVQAELHVVIEASWHARPLARAAGVLLFVVALAAGRQWYRTSRAAVRKQVADDLHDGLGGRMSAVAMMLDLRSRDAGLPAETRQQLQGAASVARQALSDLRETIWLVDADHDDLLALAHRVEAVAHELLVSVPHTVRLRLDGPAKAMPWKVRRNVLMIVREALANALRHGTPPVDVAIDVRQHRLHVVVQDHGPGLSEGTAGAGRGLRTMRQRAADIGADLSVASEHGGTRVALVV